MAKITAKPLIWTESYGGSHCATLPGIGQMQVMWHSEGFGAKVFGYNLAGRYETSEIARTAAVKFARHVLTQGLESLT